MPRARSTRGAEAPAEEWALPATCAPPTIKKCMPVESGGGVAVDTDPREGGHPGPDRSNGWPVGMLGLLSRRGLGICALLGILLLALNALVFYTSSQAVLDHEHLVTHTQDVLGTLDNTLTTILDAETGQHGYIIIASESYLAPYSRAIPFWPRSWIGRLRCPQTTRDSRQAWPRCGR